MANDDIYTALRNADAAGDTEGAQKLASYLQTSSPLIRQPEQSSTLANTVGAVGEPLLNMATGMVAKPLSDIAGLAATGVDMATGSDRAAEFKKYIQDKLTYSPRTAAGRAVTESDYNPINIIGKVIGGVSDAAGGAVAGDNPSPLRKAAGEFVQEAIPQGLSIGGAMLAKNMAGKRLLANNPEIQGARASLMTDEAIKKALTETGQTVADISPEQLAVVRNQVLNSFKDGKQIDPAALMRQADFKALDMKPTLGMVTRDPMQFTREQNLRGIEGVGDPLMARFQTLGNKLQERLSKPAEGAQNAYQAGNTLIDSMSGIDKAMKGPIDDAYRLARGSDGRYASLDIPTFSNLANSALDEGMLGHYVPGPIRSMLNDISAGKIPLNVNTQIQFDSVLSKAQRSAGYGSPEALAVSKVRDALKNTPLVEQAAPAHASTGTTVGPVRANVGPVSNDIIGESTRIPNGVDAQALFASAKGKALERFKLQDAVPALKAAAEGTVSPDDFVKRFVINGKTDEVRALGDLLSKSDQAAWNQARAQIGETLQRAAFGENAAGDAPFSASRYMATVRRLGPDKLRAFFSPAEVEDIFRTGRVGTYIKQAPNASAVNSSNAGAAIANLAGKIPGVSPFMTVGKMALDAVQKNS